MLSARALSIPTFTLVHGVLDEHATGYVPILADKVLCWGETQRRQLIEAGEPPEKVLVTGCPRLTRKLDVTPAQARGRLGLPADRPVVLLGTSPVSTADCLNLAEVFCAGVEKLDGVSALVRLHPSERSKPTGPSPDVIRAFVFSERRCHPGRGPCGSRIVVVSSSGLGSDALVKRRLAIVVETPGGSPGSRPRTRRAGPLSPRCHRRRTGRGGQATFVDAAARRNQGLSAEKYVAEFCAAFGKDAPRRVALAVSERLRGAAGLRMQNQSRKG